MGSGKRETAYPSDLTDEQWTLLEAYLGQRTGPGRPPTLALRAVVNALFYQARTGCQWRAVPHDLPPWGTLWWYFRRWRDDGVWERVNAALRERVRVRRGQAPTPSAAILDSQSAKTTEKGGRAATTRPRNSPGASAIFSSTPRGCS